MISLLFIQGVIAWKEGSEESRRDSYLLMQLQSLLADWWCLHRDDRWWAWDVAFHTKQICIQTHHIWLGRCIYVLHVCQKGHVSVMEWRSASVEKKRKTIWQLDMTHLGTFRPKTNSQVWMIPYLFEFEIMLIVKPIEMYIFLTISKSHSEGVKVHYGSLRKQ